MTAPLAVPEPLPELIIFTNSKQWQVKRVQDVELFTAPDGTEYRRTSREHATAALTWPDSKYHLPPLYLRHDSAERLLKVAARKQRRLDRRERARKERS